MQYKIYQTDSIEVLKNEKLIGGANSYQEICKTVNDYLAVNNFHQDNYWRFIMGANATFIDYGSWSKFIAVIPPLSTADML